MRVLMFFIALLCFVTAGILEITNIPGILALIVGLVALRFAFRGKKFKPKVVVSSGNEELDKLNTELFKRAVEDFNTLDREMKTLNDKELRKQVAILAVAGAEKIIERSVDEAANSDIVDKLVAEL